MSQVTLNQPAPDFELTGFSGERVRLSDYFGRKNIVLVFNRGFA
jgi:peroxiredoxin